MGAARRNDSAKIVLGYLGFGEPGITVPDLVDGTTTPVRDVDPVRHMMLEGATGGILYGDPAYQPFPAAREKLPLTTTTAWVDDELHITLRMDMSQCFLWGADPFRKFDPKARQMAMKLYDRVELKKGASEIRSVRVVSGHLGREEDRNAAARLGGGGGPGQAVSPREARL